MTIHWKVVEQYFTVVMLLFQFCPVCNFVKLISFGLATVRSERVSSYPFKDSMLNASVNQPVGFHSSHDAIHRKNH